MKINLRKRQTTSFRFDQASYRKVSVKDVRSEAGKNCHFYKESLDFFFSVCYAIKYFKTTQVIIFRHAQINPENTLTNSIEEIR